MSNVRMWTVMFWCCLAGVLVLSLMPAGVQLPDTGWDKSNHLLGFCALACTGLMAYPKRPAILLASLLADALGLALGWGVRRHGFPPAACPRPDRGRE